MTLLLGLVLAILAVGATAGEESEPAWSSFVATDFRRVELPPTLLGHGWKPSPGLRIEDLSDLSGVDPALRGLAGQLAAQLQPLGVVAAADYSLIHDGNVVTVRAFRFASAEACRAWWGRKYRSEGWEGSYREVPGDGFVAVDDRRLNKRAVAFGNVWLTAHQLGDGDEHLRALAHVMRALRPAEASPDS